MFTSRTKIQFHDCDPAGILFYANLFRHAHDIYQELLEKNRKNYFHDDEVVLPIIKATAEYFFPMKSGEEYKVDIIVSQLRDSSFELTYLFYDQQRKVYAEVKTVHVSVGKKSFQKIEIPEDLRMLLSSFRV